MSTQVVKEMSPSHVVGLLIKEKDKLSNKVEEAVQVFRQNQAEQAKTIEAQGQKISELNTIIVQLKMVNESAEAVHNAAIKTLDNRYKQKLSTLDAHLKKIVHHQDRLFVLQRNLPLCVKVAGLRFCYESVTLSSVRNQLEKHYVPQVNVLMKQIDPEFASLTRGDVVVLFNKLLEAEQEFIKLEREAMSKLLLS